MSKDKPCILHLIDSGGLYGAESVILHLSAEMKASGRYESVVGCIVSHRNEPNDLYDAAVAEGIRAEKIVIRNALLPLDIPMAAVRLKRLGIDLIHSHGYKAAVFGFALKILLSIPVLSTCHLWFIERDQPLKQKVMIAAELFCYRFFRYIVCVSEPIRDTLGNAGVDIGRTRVIPNGIRIDPDAVPDPEAAADLRESLPLDPSRYCIINTGRLVTQKAQRDIVKAASILEASGGGFAFYIVGDGPLREDLEARIEAEGVGDSVCLTGFRSDVRALLEMADLFVLPSLDEGMPMSLIEAASIGMPVVATDVGDVHKLIRNGESGLIVPMSEPAALAEAIVAMRDDPDRALEMGRRAQVSMMEIYSSTAMFREYDLIYRDLL